MWHVEAEEGHTEAVAPLEPLMDLRGITKSSPFERRNV